MPFVLGPDLDQGVRLAAELGFDAFELFPPNAEAIQSEQISKLCDETGVKLSTIGTGGGWVADRLSLTSPESDVRTRAVAYIKSLVEKAGDLGGSAIIGSMQGQCGNQDRQECLRVLCDNLIELGEYAAKWNVPLLYEPLNRYETDLVNTISDTVDLFQHAGCSNVKILADLFHMNIEEVDIAAAIIAAGDQIGHIHFVDSNRWAAGYGHTDFEPIVAAIKQIELSGHIAMEVYPRPTQLDAAQKSIERFNHFFN